MTSSPKRLAALALLERLRRYEMEDESRALSALRGQIADLTQKKDGLEAELHEQAHSSGLESATYLGDYVRAVRATLTGYEKKIAQVTPQAERLEEAVLSRFRELKTFESVRLAGLAADAAERQRRETAEQDELILLRWNRS